MRGPSPQTAMWPPLTIAHLQGTRAFFLRGRTDPVHEQILVSIRARSIAGQTLDEEIRCRARIQFLESHLSVEAGQVRVRDAVAGPVQFRACCPQQSRTNPLPLKARLDPHAPQHGRPVLGREANETNNAAVVLGNQDGVVGPDLAAVLPALVKPSDSRQVLESGTV